MDAKELAAAILDEARVQIQANMAVHFTSAYNMDERWINASGRSSEAFRVEVDKNHVRLVYEGDGIAPLHTIQDGTDEVPTIEEAAEWREDKIRSGAIEEQIPPPGKIVDIIRRRPGTERFQAHEDWIIGPVVETALQALNEQLPQQLVKDIKGGIFGT